MPSAPLVGYDRIIAWYQSLVMNGAGITQAFHCSKQTEELIAIGAAVLGPLARFIDESFPNMQTSMMNRMDVDWDKFCVCVWLISEIRRSAKLPDSPYPPNTSCENMDIERWYDYCLRNT